METPSSSPSGASVPVMTDLAETLDAVAAESTFSGVVRVDRGDEVVLETAYGFADRRWEIPNAPDTRFAMASGIKGMTALAVMSLVEVGVLDLTTTARSVLGDDLPLIDDAVTVEQLLAHRSGIGDYVDEDLPGRSPTTCSRSRCTRSPRRRTTSRCSTAFRPSSRPVSASPTATAGSSCSRSSPSARVARRFASLWPEPSASRPG